METLCGIYKITSLKKRIYIGQAVDIVRRKSEYSKLENCDGQLRLYNSLKKYGWENHKFETIHLCSELLLNELEIHYIALFKTFNTPYGLNLTKGGESILGYVWTKKQRKNVSGKNSFNYGKKASEKTKKLLRESKLGKKRSEETRKLISKSMIGKMSGEKHHMFGKKQSEESNKKRKETLKGQMVGEKNPMFGKVGGMKDKHHTKETRKLMSQVRLGMKFPNGYNKKKECLIDLKPKLVN